jgi:DNA polymerase III subunit delta'
VNDLWSQVVGQDPAISRLLSCAAAPVHAYLFIGPPGSTKNEAARAFASLLIDPSGDPMSRTARLAVAGEHPDIREVKRTGASISRDQADDIVRTAAMAPTESARKVLVLHEFHLLSADAAAKLLKTIEEPPASTSFIVLADQLPPELVTIASRCVRIDFRPISTDLLEHVLRSEGHSHDVAVSAAQSAAGDLDRARLLASDPQLVLRREAFAGAAARLDGTGTAAAAVVDELLGLIDAAAAPLADRHAEEIAVLEARVSALGERGSGRKDLTDRHKRELRRHRTDELRAGLSALAGVYRDALVSNPGRRPDALVAAIEALHSAMASLDRNPNEQLLLQNLMLHLPTVAEARP